MPRPFDGPVRLSVVVPVYNEEAGLQRFHDELMTVLDALGEDVCASVLFVDDGSSDGTPEILDRLSRSRRDVTFLRFARNFGHQAALTAGYDFADGDCVLAMDADLEHPPAVIPRFLTAWREGADIVSGVRGDTADLPLVKRYTSHFYYRVLDRMTPDTPIHANAPDFVLLDRQVVLTLRQMREQTRFLRGFYSWVGFERKDLRYEQGRREDGTSRYSLAKMLRFGLSGVLGFSRTPLRMIALLGVVISVVAFAYAVYAIIVSLFSSDVEPGWPSLAVTLSLFAGVQLLAIGVIGEYLAQVLEEVRGRPLYVIDRRRSHLDPDVDLRES